jgi:coenzyme F420 hydrogenase subunit beta
MIKEVVRRGLCTGCGTCAGFCPTGAIEMRFHQGSGFYFPYVYSEKCNECEVCTAICPGATCDFKGLWDSIFGSQPADKFLGHYKKCYLGHATDAGIRENGTSGGMVTALLDYAVSTGLVNKALVTGMDETNPLRSYPHITNSVADIHACAGSKYCPTPANMAFKENYNISDKLAIVGLGCQIQGLRKAEMEIPGLKSSIKYHFGLFCGVNLSALATEYVLWKLKIKKKSVRIIRYRGNGWPGNWSINSEKVIGPSPMSMGFNYYYFYARRCLVCIDHINDFADISFGDAWRIPEADKLGPSLIISRTEAGEQLLNQAAEAGAVAITEVDINTVLRSQGYHIYTKKSDATRTIFGKLGKKVPEYNFDFATVKPFDYGVALYHYMLCSSNSSRLKFLWILFKPLLRLPELITGPTKRVLSMFIRQRTPFSESKIICVPYGPTNAYLNPLIDAIKLLGTDIYLYDDRQHLFPLYRFRKQKIKPDIVHLHWIHFYLLSTSRLKTIVKSTLFLLDLAMARMLNIKIVWTIHNIVSHESKFPNLELFFNNLVCLFCNQIIVLSPSVKTYVRKKYKLLEETKIQVIPIGNYIDYYKNTINRSDARAKLNLNPDDLVFLFFGGIRPYKKVDELIDIFNEFITRVGKNNINLLIVGNPLNSQTKEEIRQKCADSHNIIPVLRRIDNDEIQVFMNAADTGILTFKHILGSASLVVMMSFKKPIIAPDIGNMIDLLDAKGGILYSNSDKESLLNAMEKALAFDFKCMGEHNFAIINQYTWEDAARIHLNIYRALLLN